MLNDKLMVAAMLVQSALNISINSEKEGWYSISTKPDDNSYTYSENGLTMSFDIGDLYESVVELKRSIETIVEVGKIINVGFWPVFQIRGEREKILKALGVLVFQTKEHAVKLGQSKPILYSKNGLGFLKFGESGKIIKIGNSGGQPFKLLQCLANPIFGVHKSVEAVYEAVAVTGRRKYELSEKVGIIKNTIKDIQKGKKINGKLKFMFNPKRNPKEVWLETI